MSRARRVLLVYSHFSSFVRNDHDILASQYEVERLQLGWHPRLRDRLRETHRRLWQAIGRNDAVFWWFLSDYCTTGAAFARMQRKPFVAVAGGWDVAAEKETGYGRLISGVLPRLGTKTALQLAHLVLPVSPLTDDEALRAGRRCGRVLVPNGVDTQRFRPDEAATPPARPLVVAVGAITPSNHDVKGQWIFAAVSKEVPEADFLMIGAADAKVRASLLQRGGPNLSIPGYLPGAQMLATLQRAHVVCQLSWHESFGMGLVEAMACGCVPVYADRRIGAASYMDGFGHTVPYGDIAATTRAVRRAIEDASDPAARRAAHEIIHKNIPIERRRAELLRVMDGVLRRDKLPQTP